MHPYLIDDEMRTRVFLVIAAVSVLASWLFHILLVSLPFEIPWLVETPSVVGFFGGFLWIYNNHLWKAWPFRLLPWFFIPNLNGRWKVKIISSYKGFNEEKEAIATIRQTAVRMCISVKTNNSFSYSNSASLMRTERVSTFELLYNYVNQPSADATETMNQHYGTTWLILEEDGRCLEGDYYSGRGRKNFGKITFIREDKV